MPKKPARDLEQEEAMARARELSRKILANRPKFATPVKTTPEVPPPLSNTAVPATPLVVPTRTEHPMTGAQMRLDQSQRPPSAPTMPPASREHVSQTTSVAIVIVRRREQSKRGRPPFLNDKSPAGAPPQRKRPVPSLAGSTRQNIVAREEYMARLWKLAVDGFVRQGDLEQVASATGRSPNRVSTHIKTLEELGLLFKAFRTGKYCLNPLKKPWKDD